MNKQDVDRLIIRGVLVLSIAGLLWFYFAGSGPKPGPQPPPTPPTPTPKVLTFSEITRVTTQVKKTEALYLAQANRQLIELIKSGGIASEQALVAFSRESSAKAREVALGKDVVLNYKDETGKQVIGPYAQLDVTFISGKDFKNPADVENLIKYLTAQAEGYEKLAK